MHILDEKFRKKLVDIYEGKTTTCFRRPEDIFDKVLTYLVDNIKNEVDEVRKLVDALADWTHNPTESELRKILDVKKTVYVLTVGEDVIRVFESIKTLEDYISKGTETGFLETNEIFQYVTKNGVTYEVWERYLN